MKTTIKHLQQLKQQSQPIAMLTAYNASLARVCNEAAIDAILVGDSLGNVIQGHETTVSVTLDDIAYHVRCVSNANSSCFLIADLPFMTYATVETALENATKLMQAGAMMVKLEGGAWLVPTIEALCTRGIPVCAHLGLTPQSVHRLGGFRMQAKTDAEAEQLLQDAKKLQNAGAQLLVLECIPETLAATVSKTLEIPVIGIGAGKHTDGQVSVVHDILGMSSYIPKFAKNFLAETNSIQEAIKLYVEQIKMRVFPASV